MNTVAPPVQTAPAEVESPAKVDHTITIAEVVAEIRHDSQQRPQDYLDQVHVPGGGE